MKLLLLHALATVAVALSQPVDITDYDLSEWETFQTTYLREYETVEEEAKRKSIFSDNLKYINEHNQKYKRGEKKYYLAINQFADMTNEEIKTRMSSTHIPDGVKNTGKTFQRSQLNEDLPFSFDWSAKGAVTNVKDQMSCSNGGWAFSAVGALEGQLFIKQGDLISLSEQNLLDCSGAEGNAGCSGGTVEAAYAYVQKTAGIDKEKDYTFDDGTLACRYKKAKKVGLDVTGYVQVASGDEDALQQAVYTVGPVAAAINAQETDFIFYKGGVYDDSWCFSTAEYLNHYVLVVGWDYTYDDGNFWIIKNSWGESWGDAGYMYLSQFNFNLCGIATNATYPQLA